MESLNSMFSSYLALKTASPPLSQISITKDNRPGFDLKQYGHLAIRILLI